MCGAVDDFKAVENSPMFWNMGWELGAAVLDHGFATEHRDEEGRELPALSAKITSGSVRA